MYQIYEAHDTQIDTSLDIPKEDIIILRDLAEKYAEIANHAIQKKKKEMWKKLNDLEPVRPLIWLNEVCWGEMDVDDELRLQTKSELSKRLETYFRRTIYQWQHMRGDMVVEPIIYSPLIIQNAGIGIKMLADYADVGFSKDIASRSFHNQINGEADIEKIKAPTIQHNAKRTEKFYQV